MRREWFEIIIAQVTILLILYFKFSQASELPNVIEDLKNHDLHLVVTIFRHGDRTPLQLFKNTPSEWPEGLGELTGVGMKQHYDLGSEYRKRCVKSLLLLTHMY
jgi:hypothetical protein